MTAQRQSAGNRQEPRQGTEAPEGSWRGVEAKGLYQKSGYAGMDFENDNGKFPKWIRLNLSGIGRKCKAEKYRLSAMGQGRQQGKEAILPGVSQCPSWEREISVCR